MGAEVVRMIEEKEGDVGEMGRREEVPRRIIACLSVLRALLIDTKILFQMPGASGWSQRVLEKRQLLHKPFQSQVIVPSVASDPRSGQGVSDEVAKHLCVFCASLLLWLRS